MSDYDGAEPRSSVYGNWGKRQVWSDLKENQSPGFAFNYTIKHFVARSTVTFELLKRAASNTTFEVQHVLSATCASGVVDFGAGPGCGAQGALKYLQESGVANVPNVLFLERVAQWKPATEAFSRFGIEVNFVEKAKEDVYGMINLFKEGIEGTTSDGTIVICISHVIADVLKQGDERNGWWQELKMAGGGRKLLVIVLETMDCKWILPTIPEQDIIRHKVLCQDTRNHGAAFTL